MMIQDGSGQRPVFNAKESFIERAGPYHPRPSSLKARVISSAMNDSSSAMRIRRPHLPPGSPDPIPDFSGTRPASLDAKPAEAGGIPVVFFLGSAASEPHHRSTVELGSWRAFFGLSQVLASACDRPASECTRVCGLAIEAVRQLRVDLDTTYSWPSTLSRFRQATETIVSETLCGMSC